MVQEVLLVLMESSSSSEEFQTGTLTTEPDSEVQ
jgi:hypothetical protein